MSKTIVAIACLLLPLAALAEDGQIRICRRPEASTFMDGKPVQFPGGLYTGKCDKNGENCRKIKISAIHGGTIGAGKGDCITLDALLLEDDGAPIAVGEELEAKWYVPGFDPKITVLRPFK